jgi:hypothetical protein
MPPHGGHTALRRPSILTGATCYLRSRAAETPADREARDLAAQRVRVCHAWLPRPFCCARRLKLRAGRPCKTVRPGGRRRAQRSAAAAPWQATLTGSCWLLLARAQAMERQAQFETSPVGRAVIKSVKEAKKKETREPAGGASAADWNT